MPSMRGFGSTSVDNSTIENNSSGQLQVKDSGISLSKLGSDVVLGNLVLLETIDLSAAATKTISLSGYTYYAIEFNLMSSESFPYLYCNINGDNSAEYDFINEDDGTLSLNESLNSSQFTICRMATNRKTIGSFLINSGDRFPILGNINSYDRTLKRGVYTGAETSLNNLVIWPTGGTLTGKIKVFGVRGYESS